MSKPVDPSILQKFTPLDSLKPENLLALAKKSRVHELDAGRSVFREGDNDKHAVYLLNGDIELRAGDKVVRAIQSGTPEAAHAIAPVLPRKVTARALNKIEYITVDSDLLDVLLTWDQTGSYEVGELQAELSNDSDDWMTKLLQTKALHNIPPANIQAIFMRMDKVNKKAGDIVIKQGDEGDYFYVIVSGRCNVTRETPLNKEGIRLAELRIGDTFGEEALISEAKRNATVSMITDGSLMRLSKSDFQTLLKEPMLGMVDMDEAKEKVAAGSKWLDVRLPSEYGNFHLEGAINIPLYFIRLKLKTLDKDTHYIACCDTGRRSSAAAFILKERGYNCSVLKDGLKMAGVGN
ncbi:MAG: cyclic nucleotide-binding domain-containing protein [Gammaproteobacteria bacterium]|nr:cyclic nucleotide-binding domain-containing protein [Gammaproteobacteria bacterium]NNC97359.1 cyclic nucleotide-binding domain-containing protein [Gammaproteobacteria bacterium]NNM13122.1 cyclic nucleotide-binding domain-containing protein [Gammaproteobacteria bacterium]